MMGDGQRGCGLEWGAKEATVLFCIYTLVVKQEVWLNTRAWIYVESLVSLYFFSLVKTNQTSGIYTWK